MVPLLLLFALLPLASHAFVQEPDIRLSTHALVQININSNVSQVISVTLVTDDLYHGFKRDLIPGRQLNLVHENWNFSLVYEIQIATESGATLTEKLSRKFSHNRPGIFEFPKDRLAALNLNSVTIEVLCETNWYGKLCNTLCDAKRVAMFDRYCDIDGVQTPINKDACGDEPSCEFREDVSRCMFSGLWSEKVCEALVKSTRGVKSLKKFLGF